MKLSWIVKEHDLREKINLVTDSIALYELFINFYIAFIFFQFFFRRRPKTAIYMTYTI